MKRSSGDGENQGSALERSGDGGRKEKTRLRLLEAAEDVFGRLGFHDASIVEITEKAGVALGTFYVHFPSKTEAFRELVRARRDELRTLAKQAAANNLSSHQAMLRAAFGAFFDGIASHKGAFRLIREAEFVDPGLVEELYELPAQDFQAGLELAMAGGTLPKDDAEVLAWCAAGMAEFTAMRWIVWGNGQPFTEERLDGFVEAMLRLVNSPEAGGSDKT